MNPVETSKLLDYLPAIYHDDQEFLAAYLSAFERILLGGNDAVSIPTHHDATDNSVQKLFGRMQEGAERRSLEETIDLIPALFDPTYTPKDFLPWLAGWVALSLRADLDEGAQRSFIANIIRLYRRRGTKENLIKLLAIFTQTTPEIDEEAVPSADFKKLFPQFDTDTPPLHFFKVSVVLPDPDQQTVLRKREIAQALIEMEKPAHTFYELETTFASMRIGDYADRGMVVAEEGDTIARIARARKRSVAAVALLNGLAADAKLSAGQEIKLPPYRARLEVDTLINDWNQPMLDQLKKEKDDAGTQKP
jgi:phage tail-like protein